MPNGGSLLPPISTELNEYRLSSPSRLSPLGKSPTIGPPSSNARDASDGGTTGTTSSARGRRKKTSNDSMEQDQNVNNDRRNQTTTTTTPPDEADKDAAELMMYLAHSPSPARTLQASQSPSRVSKSSTLEGGGGGGAARVLFADPGNDYKVERPSKLGLAPPITADQRS